MTQPAENERRLYLESIHGIPFTKGNQVVVLKNGIEIFPAMLKAIEEAEHTINFLTYVYWSGNIANRFAKLFARKAKEGVVVRVLLDAYGAKIMPSELIDEMKECGVRVEWFRPLKTARPWNVDNRTHRKALICDNQVALTGGVGVAEEWEGDANGPDEWRETHFEFRGPSVRAINGAFWDNWLEATSEPFPEIHTEVTEAPPPGDGVWVQIVPSSAARHFSDAAVVMKSILELARERILICTPYLVLDESYRDLLCRIARAGVEIEIIIPGEHIDKRFEHWTAEKDFKTLVEAGIRIYRYQRTMIHTKLILVDDDLACVGSPNFNQRSLRKDDEIIVHIHDREICRKLESDFCEDREHSIRVEDTDWMGSSVMAAIKRFAVYPFREQL